MYTQCPECLTVYRPLGAELAAARGHVCCSHCAAVFDALPCLSEQEPAEPIGRLLQHAEQDEPPTLSRPFARPPLPAADDLFFDPDARPPLPTVAAAAPQFARSMRITGPTRQGRWIAACALLGMILIGQIAWTERSWLALNPQLRPWLERACVTFDCSLPLRRDDAQMQLASRDIRPHPSMPGALIISATLHNSAAFAQPFPQVGITLSDLESRRVAMRRFQPLEYVGDSRTLQAGLASDASVALVFEVADPGQEAVAFEFSFN